MICITNDLIAAFLISLMMLFLTFLGFVIGRIFSSKEAKNEQTKKTTTN